jgi:hypothetical protein
VSVGVIALAE